MWLEFIQCHLGIPKISSDTTRALSCLCNRLIHNFMHIKIVKVPSKYKTLKDMQTLNRKSMPKKSTEMADKKHRSKYNPLNTLNGIRSPSPAYPKGKKKGQDYFGFKKRLWIPSFSPIFLKETLFIWERQRERAHKQEEEQRGTEKQTPCWAQGPMLGSISWPEIVTWAEIKNRTPNRLSHPGTPQIPLFKSFLLKYNGNPTPHTGKGRQGAVLQTSYTRYMCPGFSRNANRCQGKDGYVPR